MPKRASLGESILIILIWIITPIIQLLIGYASMKILGSNVNSSTLAAGAGFALLVIAGVIAFISGFILTPLTLHISGVHKNANKQNV